MSFDLSSTTWGVVKQYQYEAVLLPWGATEPHNYHLPYTTDGLLSHAVAMDAARKAEVQFGVKSMVLPPLCLGQQNLGQWQLPFCLHFSFETQKAVLMDIVQSLSRQGYRSLIIINGHGGNCFKPMIRDIGFLLPTFRIALADWYAIVPQKEYFEERDDHAGELETSVMLHYYPEKVDLSLAGDGKSSGFSVKSLHNGTGWIPRNWSKVSVDTGIGNPKKATAAKGKQYVDEVTNRLAQLIADICKEELY